MIAARTRLVVLRDHERLVLDGQGSTLIFHGRVQPLTILGCRDVRVADLSLDRDAPLTAQAQIGAIESTPGQATVDLRLSPESAYRIEQGRLIFTNAGRDEDVHGLLEFDPHATWPTRPATSASGPAGSATPRLSSTPGLVRLAGDLTRLPAVGNTLVLRHGARDHAAVYVGDSERVTLERVTVHHSAGLGVLCQASADLTFTELAFRPNTDRAGCSPVTTTVCTSPAAVAR